MPQNSTIHVTDEYTTPVKTVFGYSMIPRRVTHYSDGSMYIEPNDERRIIQEGLPESLKQQMLAHYPAAKML